MPLCEEDFSAYFLEIMPIFLILDIFFVLDCFADMKGKAETQDLLISC